MHLSTTRRSLLAVAASLLALAGTAGPAFAAQNAPSTPTAYHFATLDDQADLTFNQLLGINDHGLIAGYFGSGAAGHPNKGYLLAPPYGQGNYTNENFPDSAQTQVTGLNNRGVTVGFWADKAGNDFGFYRLHGKYVTVAFPSANKLTPSIDQLLGVNDRGLAVGFYTDVNGANHGYTYDIRHHRYEAVSVPGFGNNLAAAINDHGTIAGFVVGATGADEGFVLKPDGDVTLLKVPDAASTQALGISNTGEVVGQFTDAAGKTHGFTWTRHGGFQTVDDPNGLGTTTLNGVNDHGQLVGFYVDAGGNTDGLLATP